MRIFKQHFGPKGNNKTTANYYIEFKDHNDITRRVPAFKDEKASTEFGRKLEKLVDLRIANERPEAELRRWLESLPNRIRQRLAKFGLLDSRTIAASKLLSEHVADFKRALLDKGNSTIHANTTAYRVTAIMEGLGATFVSGITASAVERYLADRRAAVENALSIRSSNHYLTAAKSFFNWLVKDRRLSDSPIAHLSKLNERTDRRHIRRALLADELRRLLTAARTGAESHGMSGTARELLYWIAVETGLRAGELRSLTRASFGFDTGSATVTVAAAYSKRRRDDTLDLRPELAKRLMEFTATLTPTAQVFRMPEPYQVVLMLKQDLEAAGIPYSDESGHVADFHSLRHTFISNLAAGGIHPKTAQELARHSSIVLTMDCYSHVAREKLTSALDTLPDLSKPERESAKATGTYDVTPDEPQEFLPESLPIAGAERCASMQDNATNGVENGDEMVRGGLEPPTHGFSVHCSTN